MMQKCYFNKEGQNVTKITEQNSQSLQNFIKGSQDFENIQEHNIINVIQSFVWIVKKTLEQRNPLALKQLEKNTERNYCDKEGNKVSEVNPIPSNLYDLLLKKQSQIISKLLLFQNNDIKFEMLASYCNIIIPYINKFTQKKFTASQLHKIFKDWEESLSSSKPNRSFSIQLYSIIITLKLVFHFAEQLSKFHEKLFQIEELKQNTAIEDQIKENNDDSFDKLYNKISSECQPQVSQPQSTIVLLDHSQKRERKKSINGVCLTKTASQQLNPPQQQFMLGNIQSDLEDENEEK